MVNRQKLLHLSYLRNVVGCQFLPFPFDNARSFPSTVMQLLNWLRVPSLLFVAMAVVAQEPPTELQIETTYLPDDCTQKAAKGDSIEVHYVRRLNVLLVSFCDTHNLLQVLKRLHYIPDWYPLQ